MRQRPSLLRMWSPFISLSLNLCNSLDHNGETLKTNHDIFKVLWYFFFVKMSEKKTKTRTYLWPNKDKDILWLFLLVNYEWRIKRGGGVNTKLREFTRKRCWSSSSWSRRESGIRSRRRSRRSGKRRRVMKGGGKGPAVRMKVVTGHIDGIWRPIKEFGRYCRAQLSYFSYNYWPLVTPHL